MKKIEGYTKEICICGVPFTLTLVKRIFKGTRVFYDSYLTDHRTEITILLDNMEKDHPYLGKLSIKRITEMAEEQAYDLFEYINRLTQFDQMLSDFAEEINERISAREKLLASTDSCKQEVK